MARIGLLLAHEHGFLRAALRVFLDAQPDMRVLGEAGDARELLQRAREKKPEVVLIDSGLPGATGTKAIVQTLRVCPRARVLVLAVHDDPASARSALTAGASGLVVKISTELELLSAIRAVHRGHAFVDARIAARPGRRAAPACRPRPPVSAREQQVLGLLSRGIRTARSPGASA